MTKHTPGPWTIEHENDVGPNDEGYWEWLQVGPARVDLPRNDGIGVAYDRAHANARLIAAAPDMLAALNEIERDVGASLIGNPFAEIERLRSVARAAIAKAKGEAA